ncbi:unnamed protein product [Adineta ricciae]|uniref:Uncharacterized protein n=1 Tax=Adineta ricciae TaxID=249248 RepID=A0A813QUF3_ADIRI|nr:unnamed protein product [Adineta ricciae]CAF0834541.1 unnamed protein product [Adineta ricciae]
MTSRFILICICFLLQNCIYASIPFTMNPGCQLPQCNDFDHTALYYVANSVGDSTIHMIYSSFDELTIGIFETAKGENATINYPRLFAKNYTGAITFDGVKPTNSFFIVLRRIIEFIDIDDDGKLTDNDNITASHWIKDILTNNVTFVKQPTEQPTFVLPLEMINGTLTVDIVYDGTKKRDSKFPKLMTAPKSIFLNIAFQAEGFNSSKTRFAFELLQLMPGIEGTRIYSSRYIDDQYTPGIFNVWQLRTQSPLYSASMLWKPVVYQSEDRTIEQNTLMQIYGVENNFILDPTIDQGIYRSILPVPVVSAFNVSLGQANDGFFTKTNYTFVQFTAGLDLLEPDSTAGFVTVALIVSLALPAIVGVTAVIFMIKRKVSPPSSTDGI